MKSLAFLLGFLSAACVDPLTVVIDPLHVINWSPSSGATCVDPLSAVHVTFSDDLDIDTLTPQTFKLLDAAGPMAGPIVYDQRVQTASFTPDPALEFGRQYTIVVTREVSGRALGSLPIELESPFKTVGRIGCTPEPRCQLNSDCPTGEICTSIGECGNECVTDRDCPLASTCANQSCT